MRCSILHRHGFLRALAWLMAKRKHFKVEPHPPNQWRIVNDHIGHGLVFPTRQMAEENARILNSEFDRWIEAEMETNPFAERPPVRN
jgi:hypothetical protein